MSRAYDMLESATQQLAKTADKLYKEAEECWANANCIGMVKSSEEDERLAAKLDKIVLELVKLQ